MISFLIRTSIRENGCSRLSLTLGSSPSSPGTARTTSSSELIAASGPATKRLIPSVLSRIVPLSPPCWQASMSTARSGLSPSSGAKR